MLNDKQKQRLISLLDLTSLNDQDDEHSITALCEKAKTPYGNVAAVCIYPQFVNLAKLILEDSNVRIATVANFPAGNEALADCIHDIRCMIEAGADEIDVVMPYRHYLDGARKDVLGYLQACRGVCGDAITMKVILETGALVRHEYIMDASELAIKAGANFIKTSTGKYKIGATPQAMACILDIIKRHPEKSIGFKAAGGIREIAQVLEYYQLVVDHMGEEWVSPQHLRFGASQLLAKILDSA